ncbi:MarC family protein [Maritimibacter sp. UBA3975]|uniref:MarC family protein n=1 Tax=Maritimibacter sp. UBA3975 TaxID=1946833 RepID=UPI000C0A7D9B|nr:MarC family protein [Maritimibacter sp. UBA3975]MAM60231.1 MarC family transcriptional regulator [Maritimibacter sp.]
MDALLPAFVTLFVIIDPIGLAPVFLALTKDMTGGHRRAVALRAVLVAAVILTVFGLAGQAVLDLFGISMAAFRIAGGALLFLTALDMLFERRKQRRESQSEASVLDPADDPSVFPLAMPLISGPGAMATMILLMGETDEVMGKLTIIGVMVAVLVCVFAFFVAAGALGRHLKETGISVVTRLLGMLLAALAIQFMIDGLAQTGLFG